MDMNKTIRILGLIALVALAFPLIAGAVTEPKTKTEYPDAAVMDLTSGAVSLKVTGVGLREKTFLKVDVYTIVSYVGADFADTEGEALMAFDGPKRLQMDLRRGFSSDKLKKAFSETIEKNYDDMSAFEGDMAIFLAYFERDAEENDLIIFDYAPGVGVTTTLNGEVKGTVNNAAFAEALWSVWFGKKPANGDLKKALLAELGS
jgi:hypothetical protein